MRPFFLLLCLLLSLSGKAQRVPTLKETHLWLATKDLDSALVHRDTEALSKLLMPYATIGHSNALIQNKQEILTDLTSGKITYTRIQDLSGTYTDIFQNVGTVRRNLDVAGTLSGTAFNVKIHVLETWLYRHKHWYLLSRQSAKHPQS